jgi:uncharacterized metal-binding protein YceD (DUF177 family)
MNSETATPLTRKLRIETIGEGTNGTIETREDERRAIAKLLDLVALDGLVLEYRLAPSSRGRIRMNGRLAANVVQTCVVSLDPVPSALEVPVEVEFWPEGAVAALEKTSEKDPGASLLDWPEPIEDGTIDLGKVLYEALATALDPYPKKPGASFEWSEGPTVEAASRKSGPFAALERLKRR